MAKKKETSPRAVSWLEHVLNVVTAFAGLVKVNEDGEVEDTGNNAAWNTVRKIIRSCDYDEDMGNIDELDHAFATFLASHTAAPGTVFKLTSDDVEVLPRIAQLIHETCATWLKDRSSNASDCLIMGSGFFAQFGTRLDFGEEIDAGRPAKYALRGEHVVNAERLKDFDPTA